MPVGSVVLGARARERIADHAAAACPLESCGILIGRPDAGLVRIAHALPCLNRAPPAERGRRFEIDPRAVIDAQRDLRATGQEVVGFYHSHPDGSTEPSGTDREYIRLWPETVWLIAGVPAADERATLRAWWLDADPGAPVRELSIRSGTRAQARSPARPD